MLLKNLQRVHSDYDDVTWQKHEDLVAGGAQFHGRIERYLPQNDREPTQVYKRRCDHSYYLGYCSAIVGYFGAWLFASPLKFQSDPEQVDEFYTVLKEDCDGLGTDLDEFLKAAFVRACTTQRAYWQVKFPSATEMAPGSRLADWQKQGLGRAVLAHLPTENVVNWRRDESGAWMWVLTHECIEELVEVDDEEPTLTERWVQWYADGSARAWEKRYVKSSPPQANDAIGEIEPPYNPTGAIPIVELTVPHDLYIMGLLADGQLEHFRKSNALGWSIERTCYAMPVFFLKNPQSPPVMGAGYYLILGHEDKVEWPAPPPAPYETIQNYTTRLKEELHRVSRQMAVAIDASASATARSGESKDADNRATEVILSAFGKIVRGPVEKTYQLISAGRGEDITWQIGGMDKYQIPDAKGMAETALIIQSLRIPSATLHRELYGEVGATALPNLDETKKKMIRDEIQSGVTDEDVAMMHEATVAGEEATIKNTELIGKEPPNGFAA